MFHFLAAPRHQQQASGLRPQRGQATLKDEPKIHLDLGKPPPHGNTWSAEPNTIRSVTNRWLSQLTVSEKLSQKEQQHLTDYRGLFSLRRRTQHVCCQSAFGGKNLLLATGTFKPTIDVKKLFQREVGGRANKTAEEVKCVSAAKISVHGALRCTALCSFLTFIGGSHHHHGGCQLVISWLPFCYQ